MFWRRVAAQRAAPRYKLVQADLSGPFIHHMSLVISDGQLWVLAQRRTMNTDSGLPGLYL